MGSFGIDFCTLSLCLGCILRGLSLLTRMKNAVCFLQSSVFLACSATLHRVIGKGVERYSVSTLPFNNEWLLNFTSTSVIWKLHAHFGTLT
jgi:hypothetical protein